MYYAVYKGVRDCAWQCFLDFKIYTLPVDVLKIARAANIKVVENSIVGELDPTEKGKTYFDGVNWVIIYDDRQDVMSSRFTVAHELGHIFLGHALTHTKYENVREFGKKPRTEQQADMFAIRLLCPACVLHKIKVGSAEELSEICRIPLRYAETRYDRLVELNKRNRFLESEIEKKVFDGLKPYILSQLRQRELYENLKPTM